MVRRAKLDKEYCVGDNIDVNRFNYICDVLHKRCKCHYERYVDIGSTGHIYCTASYEGPFGSTIHRYAWFIQIF